MNYYPKDLAKKVFSIFKTKKQVVIPLEILNELFELMFFSSLKTEELKCAQKSEQSIKV